MVVTMTTLSAWWKINPVTRSDVSPRAHTDWKVLVFLEGPRGTPASKSQLVHRASR